MAKCSFCGKKIKPGTGLLFVKRDATALFFCSNKCEKNLLQLKRHPTTTIWTEVFQDAKKAEKKKEKQREKTAAEEKGEKVKPRARAKAPKKKKKKKKRGKRTKRKRKR